MNVNEKLSKIIGTIGNISNESTDLCSTLFCVSITVKDISAKIRSNLSVS